MKLKFIIVLLLIVSGINAQNRQHAFEVNERLGRGINYGNMFEGLPSWGNPWKPEFAGMIANLGFNHVRIPIRWEPSDRSSVNPPYTVNPVFLNKIKQVVDSALNNNLHAIINMHHHDALFENPENNKERFLAQWKQISEFFANYPDSLLFEILNEPHGNLTAAKWNVFAADALETIREDNPERIVLVGTPDWGGLGGLPYLQLPEDENIILTIHYYDPFQFTHQGAGWVEGANDWLGTVWNDSETEREVIQQAFAPLQAFSVQNHIPIHIGEFGSYSKADEKSRIKWTTYLSRFLETKDWSWAYWEFSAGFGIYNPSNRTYNQELVDALLYNEMPEPAKYVGTPIYTSNFQNSNDGWSFTRHQGTASLSRVDNSLKVTIADGGTEGWHLQLVRNNIKIEEGKEYRFSFKAKAEAARSATVYIGMTKDPWSAHSGYYGMALADTFSVYTYVFKSNITDNSARIVFDIGKSDADFLITDVLLEEIILQWPTSVKVLNDYKTTIYPNPVSDKIFINNLDEFKTYSILNMQGAVLETGVLNEFLNQIEIANFAQGMYFISLTDNNKKYTSKILKK